MPDGPVLSVMLLDPAHADARRETQDLQRMHARVAALTDGAASRVLWALPSRTLLAIQAPRPVTAAHLPAGYARRVVHADQLTQAASLNPGDQVTVTLVANPAKCVSADGAKNGKRTPLRSNADRVAWLVRKLGVAATLDDVTVTDLGTGSGSRRGTAVLIRRVRYDATLTVVDTAALAALVASGVGPAKGYGCGLLLVGEAA